MERTTRFLPEVREFIRDAKPITNTTLSRAPPAATPPVAPPMPAGVACLSTFAWCGWSRVYGGEISAVAEAAEVPVRGKEAPSFVFQPLNSPSFASFLRW